MPRSATPLKVSRLVILASVCLTVAALYFAQTVLIPLALAVLVTFLLTPLVMRLERAGLPRVPAVVILVAGLITLVTVLGWVVYAQLTDLAEELPRYKDDIVLKMRTITGREAGAFDKAAEAIEDVHRAVSSDEPATSQPGTAPSDPIGAMLTQLDRRFGEGAPRGTEDNPIHVRETPPQPTLTDRFGGLIPGAAAIAGTAGLVLVFVLFMLITREDLRDRLIRLIGYGQLQVTTQALDDAASRISRYLLAQAVVNGTYGIVIAIGLWLIGYSFAGKTFPNFVLWGLLCALLRFIPYIGPWIAAAFPIALAFAVFPGYGTFVAVCALFVVVEVLSNNLMEPWLYGSSTGMSSVAVLAAAVFWTWLWGPIGLVMATPLTVCLVVMGKYVPPLKFFDIMLGDEPVLAPGERVYQRLLAGDQEEATDVVESLLKDQSLEEVFDTVLLPALALAETDQHAGRLDDDRSRFIRGAMREMIEELADEERAAELRRAAEATAAEARDGMPEQAAPAQRRARIPGECVVNVMLLPAHDEADEIVGIMLAQLLELRGFCAFPLSYNALAGEMINDVEKRGADVVVVSALPPAAVAHARYLCKRLHAQFPEIPTVVGLWTVRGDLKKARERIMCSNNVRLAVSFAQALEQVRELAQPKIVGADARNAGNLAVAAAK